MSDGIELLEAGFALLHVAPVLAGLSYLRAEAAHRERWAAFAKPKAVIEPSAYRSGGPIVTGYLSEAPGAVRLAACSSMLFGSMFVPGFAWALLGILMGGYGFLGIPGLIVAGLLWGAGHGLLRGTAEAAANAARAARYAAALNVVILVAAIGAIVLWEGMAVLAVGTAVYAVLSLLQAWVLAKGARALAALHRSSSEDAPEPPFVDTRDTVVA